MDSKDDKQKKGRSMSDAYVIELQGNMIGIIVRKHTNEDRYKFLAAQNTFNSLDGQEFEGPFQAEMAARRLLKRTSRGSRRELSRNLSLAS